ncbi:uncharacterized protein LOC131023929 isoform X2 [Salvia miltiorrhiza]|uniref:uncharacterized protein LOC131023929 isoform X2 n=1 Tax=Salvia miltiorrhiza TaxID=226208 RepID=UPI0025ABE3DA|nr:uncharacterized protein LOC131023929 isoform X2 [Salvia miltiorrhiza]
MEVEEGDFNLKEWGVRARRISRENTKSRRFSASNLKSLREEAASFRSNVTVSSTASSPGYIAVREEIDPSTYSFTTALRALQAKTVYTWEVQGRDGLTLNSKWNEAEKYISNPLSGEVPLECLSAKTLSGRSFRRMTMSAPLIYPSQMHHFPPNNEHEHEHEHDITSAVIRAEKIKKMRTRDVGTQSTPIDLSSSSPSPAPTPSIEERSIKMRSEAEAGDSSVSFKSDTEVEVKETGEREENGGERKKQWGMGCYCVSLRGLWMRTQRQKEKHKMRTNNTTFLHQLNA